MDTLSFSNHDISRLYIKLDKKLTLKIGTLSLPSSDKKLSFSEVLEGLDDLEYLLSFFEYIDIQEVKVKGKKIGILFHNDMLQVSTKEYLVRGFVTREGKMLTLTFPLLYSKAYNINMSADIVYDLYEDSLLFKGKFEFDDALGAFTFSKEKERVSFLVKSNVFHKVEEFVKIVPLSKSIKEWIGKKVKAKAYKLSYLKGEGTFKDKKFLLDNTSLEGEVLFGDLYVSVQKGLSPLRVEGARLLYKDDTLFFHLKSPTFKKKNLSGTHFSIGELQKDDIRLKLDVNMLTSLDKEIKKVLKSYKIKIPLHQTKGKAKVFFKADIGLCQKHKKNSYYVKAKFLTISRMVFHDIPINLTKGEVEYKDNMIYLKNLYIKEKLYQGLLGGKVLLKSSQAKLNFNAKSIVLKNKKRAVVKIKNKKLAIDVKYKKDIEVKIPSLALKIKQTKRKTTLFCDNLKKIAPYIVEAQALKEGGKVEVSTKNFKKFSFKGILKRKECFIFDKNNQCQTQIDFKGLFGAKNFYVDAFKKRLKLDLKKNRLEVNNLNIDLEQLLLHKQQGAKKNQKLLIIGKNSYLRYGNHWLLSDSYDIEVKANGDVSAIGSAKGDIVKFSKKGETLSIRAFRIKDKILHPLVNFNGLTNGRYSLKQDGNPNRVMRGEIVIEGGLMKDFKAYNNTLAFINTIPALVALQNPGFSKKGFVIQKGIIKYKLIKKTLVRFEKIQIQGASATLIGKGEIDLKTHKIKMLFAIQVARKLGKIIGKIPLLGYILMGKDKSMTVGLSVEGTFEKPIVTTSATQEFLSLPLELLKRTLDTPKRLIKK